MAQGSLIYKIKTSYEDLTRLEKKVADYVLANPKSVVKMTINELANNCGVGDTTVFRFCRTMELGGYQDFKLSLALSAGYGDMLDSKENINLEGSHDLRELARNVSAVFTDSVNETFSALDYEAFSAAVDALLVSDSVYLYGFGNSAISAMMLQNRLMRIRPNVFCSSDVHTQLTSASMLGPSSTSVVFCNSGVTRDCIRIAQMSHQAGAKTIFITKFVQTPAAQYADVLLVSGATEGPIQGGSIAAISSQMYLVSILYSELFRRLGDAARESKIKTSQAIADKKL